MLLLTLLWRSMAGPRPFGLGGMLSSCHADSGRSRLTIGAETASLPLWPTDEEEEEETQPLSRGVWEESVRQMIMQSRIGSASCTAVQASVSLF